MNRNSTVFDSKSASSNSPSARATPFRSAPWLTNRYRFSGRSNSRSAEAAANTSRNTRCRRGSRKARSHSGRHAPITAPLLGTFYVAPEPGAPPFVKVGQQITEDTTVGLIEVMKVFNSVRAAVVEPSLKSLRRTASSSNSGRRCSSSNPKSLSFLTRDDLFSLFERLLVAFLDSGAFMTVTRVLVANRGEIAVRIIRACQASASKPLPRFRKRTAKAWRRGWRSGPSASARRAPPTVILKSSLMPPPGPGCDALHPGYGFLRSALAFASLRRKWHHLRRSERRKHYADGR